MWVTAVKLRVAPRTGELDSGWRVRWGYGPRSYVWPFLAPARPAETQACGRGHMLWKDRRPAFLPDSEGLEGREVGVLVTQPALRPSAASSQSRARGLACRAVLPWPSCDLGPAGTEAGEAARARPPQRSDQPRI